MTYLVAGLIVALVVAVGLILFLWAENTDLRRTLTMSRHPAGKRLGGQL